MNGTEAQSYQEFESLPARMVGILRSPRAVLAHVIVRPRWVSVLLVTTVTAAACSSVLLETAVGRQALVDEWERTALAFGQEVDNARYEELQRLSEHGAVYGVLTALARGPLLAFGAAGAVFWGLGRRRGGARFTQVLAIAAHAGVILALRQVVAAPINYARESLASPATLGRFFPMLDEMSLAARFLGMIDLFVVWWMIVLATGVAMLAQLPARPIAAAFAGTYVTLALALAAVMALTGGVA